MTDYLGQGKLKSKLTRAEAKKYVNLCQGFPKKKAQELNPPSTSKYWGTGREENRVLIEHLHRVYPDPPLYTIPQLDNCLFLNLAEN